MKRILLFAAMALISAAAFAQPKFAHVNFTELYQLMPEADQARATLNAATAASTWTQTIRESKEKELSDIQQRLMEFEQSIQQELAAKQNELMAPLVQKAQDTVSSIAKAGGYVYVFDAPQMLYIDPAQSTDLTPAARKALNIPEGRTLETLQAELQAAAQAQ